jgi:uncharacterized membrane protein
MIIEVFSGVLFLLRKTGYYTGHVYKVQRSVCYISKVLSGCEARYNQVQKLLYAVLSTKHKIMHYFESPYPCSNFI